MRTHQDIRGLLRRDHEAASAALDSLRSEDDEARCLARLRKARRAWVVHALAEEAVVYRVLDGVAAAAEAGDRADERFIEHDLVDGMFDKLTHVVPGTPEWRARINMLRELIVRHIAHEQQQTFGRLGARFDADELDEMAQQFVLVRDKLKLLEDAKDA
jgi:hypothetical protein